MDCRQTAADQSNNSEKPQKKGESLEKKIGLAIRFFNPPNGLVVEILPQKRASKMNAAPRSFQAAAPQSTGSKCCWTTLAS
jgi:hypothetical protein